VAIREGYKWVQKPRLGSQPDVAHPRRQGLVLDLPFLSGGGTTEKDYSGNNAVVGPWSSNTAQTFDWRAGVYGPCLSFNQTVVGDLKIIGAPACGPAMSLFCRFKNNSLFNSSMLVERESVNATWELFFEASSLIFRGGSNSNRAAIPTSGNLTSNTWYDVLVTDTGVLDGTNTALGATIYVNGLAMPMSQAYSNATPPASNTNPIHLGQYDAAGNYTYFGQMDRVIVWNRCLSAAEALSLTADPWADWLVPTTRRWFVPAGGGVNTPFTKSFTGSLTSAGVITRASAKAYAGSLTSSGVTTKAAAKSYAGAMTSAGNLSRAVAKGLAGALTSSGSLRRAVARVMTGALTSSGALIRATAKALTGSLTASGAFSKGALNFRAFAGAMTSAGALTRNIGKPFTGSLTATGALTRAVAKGFTGAMASAGALIKAGAKTLSGSLTASGAWSGGKIKTVVFAGSLAASGFLTRLTGKAFAGSLTASSSLSKAIAKIFAGGLAASGNLVKSVFRLLLGAVTAVGAWLGVKRSGSRPTPIQIINGSWSQGSHTGAWASGNAIAGKWSE
jgi:hypothetical protein